MYITECTLELQWLPRCELSQLAGGQRELIALELKGDRGLWLGDPVLTACYVRQLGDLHNISTFNRTQWHTETQWTHASLKQNWTPKIHT